VTRYSRGAAAKAQASTLVEQHVDVPLRSDGGLRIAVIADTHGAPHPKTAEVIAAMQPDHILHAGDIGDLACLAPFRAIAPTTVVRGNIDPHAPDLPDLVTVDVCAGGARVLRMMLFHIAVAGPRLRADAGRLAVAREASLVVCGHSHVPFIGRDRGLSIFNPGSIGPKRFQLPIVFGMMEIAGGKLTMRHHDCATGDVWLP
jgi:uncharacterized protein